MYEDEDFFIPLLWEGDGPHPSPNYDTRYANYGVQALPSSAFDAEVFDLGGGAGVLARYQTIYGDRVNVSSPMEIDVVMNIDNNGDVEITADVLLTETIPTDDYNLLFLLTNEYSASYHSTVTRYYEEPFTLYNSGASGQFIHTFTPEPSWDMAKVRAVVLVQHQNTTGVFTVTGYPQYPFNMYPILQGGLATFPLIAPNPIANQEMQLNETATFDLTDYFYYQGSPVAATLSVQSSDPTIVDASINGTTLTLESFNNGGLAQIDIMGEYSGYNAMTSFNVFVLNPTDRNVIIWDLDPTPSGSALQSSIENFYSAGDVVLTDDINQYPLSSTTDALFVLLGIYSNNYTLSDAEASLMATYLDNGGNVYMEGGDTWYYDTQTSVHPYFNIDPLSDGGSDLSNVDGHDFLAGMSWTYSGENNWIDQLAPIAPAVTLFSNPTVGYDCGIAYDAGTYKTVGTSFEITGLGGTNTLDDAVSGIIDFFDIGGAGPTLDPPINLAVDETTGLFTWDAPAGNNGWLDDMEAYTPGVYLAVQSDEWTTWSGTSGGSDDGFVVDENAYSGSNSVKVEGTSTDLVHEFGTFTSGVYDVSMMVYIEPGYGGYYNLLHYFNGSSSEWGMEVYFGSSGTGDLCATAQNILTFTHPVGSWFESKCIIDLDSDWAEYYIDGTMIYEWQWSIDTNGNPGSCEFGATDIYASAPTGDDVMFYFDDVTLNVLTPSRELQSYNVYLDGTMMGNTDDSEWMFEDLVNGQTYTAGVEAVYDEGVSTLATIDFVPNIVNANNNIIAKTELNGNYPNPFNPTTNISFSLKNSGHVKLEVYNIKGEKVVTLIDDELTADDHVVAWNGKDTNGKQVSSGVYFYKMKAADYTSSKKMILLK
ncbi:MAG: T9SS type A sorting domain-containing protein [Candidatus Cloacimonetes bacterium]|nr:T9SS type A sorting domain-containing protein [Candidatus Cloacimonadota bacterium]MCF7814578.1 T9SS type A sorting domain-containing protein [Candidatus Cloacimonadota bacterium]MCF7869092.1 T9SS type A sorting domain-containing protein [Candidatus Cloacimonadota bacterium]MCF7884509.1 T9SS type A sorting domain-containing protein [Candidatus Cloacimonadota bacterium]